jgi:hypothetical protein
VAVRLPVLGHQHGRTHRFAGVRCAPCLAPPLAGGHGRPVVVDGDQLPGDRRRGRHLGTGKQEPNGHLGWRPRCLGGGTKGGRQEPSVRRSGCGPSQRPCQRGPDLAPGDPWLGRETATQEPTRSTPDLARDLAWPNLGGAGGVGGAGCRQRPPRQSAAVSDRLEAGSGEPIMLKRLNCLNVSRPLSSFLVSPSCGRSRCHPGPCGLSPILCISRIIPIMR